MSQRRRPGPQPRPDRHPFRGWLAAMMMISGAPMALLFATSRADRRAEPAADERQSVGISSSG